VNFSYIAKNNEGQEIRSSVDAPSRLEALELLRKKGLVVIDLFGVDTDTPGFWTAVTPHKKIA
jgi:type II secretory pathway component PulF